MSRPVRDNWYRFPPWSRPKPRAIRPIVDGWIVDGQPCWDPMQGSWWMMPNIPSTLESLEAAYQRGKGTSQKAIDGMREYDADVVFNTHWKPILKALA
jgi:hypothetical protein